MPTTMEEMVLYVGDVVVPMLATMHNVTPAYMELHMRTLRVHTMDGEGWATYQYQPPTMGGTWVSCKVAL